MTELATVLLALAGLAIFHYVLQRGTRKVGRAIGKRIASVLRSPLRRVLAIYYRRKVIRQLQEQRRKQGLPPLENPDTL